MRVSLLLEKECGQQTDTHRNALVRTGTRVRTHTHKSLTHGEGAHARFRNHQEHKVQASLTVDRGFPSTEHRHGDAQGRVLIGAKLSSSAEKSVSGISWAKGTAWRDGAPEVVSTRTPNESKTGERMQGCVNKTQ